MHTTYAALLILSLISLVFSAPRLTSDILRDEDREATVKNKPVEKHYEMLGVFEPFKAYFTMKRTSELLQKRGRRQMKCIRYNAAVRKCSRYALVGMW